MGSSTFDSPDQALARILRRLRQDSGSTQEHVAHHAGITVGSLARIELGQANPRWTTVGRIVRALNISLIELIAEFEDVPL
jgi:transcriptional regulator with XRE-family HTH domain